MCDSRAKALSATVRACNDKGQQFSLQMPLVVCTTQSMARTVQQLKPRLKPSHSDIDYGRQLRVSQFQHELEANT